MPDDALSDRSCAGQLRLLSDDTRMAVMEQLLDGPKRVGVLVTALDVEQSLLSHHLRVLRDGGLVSARRMGREVEYELATPVTTGRRGLDLGCCTLSFPESPS